MNCFCPADDGNARRHCCLSRHFAFPPRARGRRCRAHDTRAGLVFNGRNRSVKQPLHEIIDGINHEFIRAHSGNFSTLLQCGNNGRIRRSKPVRLVDRRNSNSLRHRYRHGRNESAQACPHRVATRHVRCRPTHQLTAALKCIRFSSLSISSASLR